MGAASACPKSPATRNRTRDHLISATLYSQMLYQLSYSRLYLCIIANRSKNQWFSWLCDVVWHVFGTATSLLLRPKRASSCGQDRFSLSSTSCGSHLGRNIQVNFSDLLIWAETCVICSSGPKRKFTCMAARRMSQLNESNSI